MVALVAQRQGVVGNRGFDQGIVGVADYTEGERIETVGIAKHVGQIEVRVESVFFDVNRSDRGYDKRVRTEADNLEGIVLDFSVHGIARIGQPADAAESESREGYSQRSELGNGDRDQIGSGGQRSRVGNMFAVVIPIAVGIEVDPGIEQAGIRCGDGGQYGGALHQVGEKYDAVLVVGNVMVVAGRQVIRLPVGVGVHDCAEV